jgi:hypothetical protein
MILVGGTTQVTPSINGARVAYVFDPSAVPAGNAWTQQLPMLLRRWYPSATWVDNRVTDTERVLSTGGRPANSNLNDDSYEACSVTSGPFALTWTTWLNGPTADRRFPGPSLDLTNPPSFPLYFYARIHALGNAQDFRSGWQPHGAAITHIDGPTRGSWIRKGETGPARIDGTSILFPNIDDLYTDAVMILGGMGPDPLGNPPLQAYETVQICKASATAPGPFDDPSGGSQQGWDWKTLPSMQYKRRGANGVILPDASILVFGGEDGTTGILQAERFNGAVWQPMANAFSYHGYHSTALLLPSGKVLLAGGETAHPPPGTPPPPWRSYDYEIYSPPYFFCGNPRPTWTATPGPNVTYNQQVLLSYSLAGGTIGKVVLIRAGSITHHSDFDQRYVQVPFSVEGTGSVVATMPVSRPSSALPPNSLAAPRGWYMLFLVSNLGVPSVAQWINLQ